jgi:3-(3-hydroxy-phenyl)propionate hydroxylase
MSQERYVADVVIVGAGPVGLTLANILGLQGVRTLVVDERPSVIDYPRGVGLDDEAIRTFQSIGLVDRILPHTVPNQILRFYDANRQLLAEMAPPDARFGWPKRNGFVQPMVDAELLAGLDRFDHVEVAWNPQAHGCFVRRHHILDTLAGHRLRQRSARPSQQRGGRGSRAAVRLDRDRARNSPLRVHDSR